MSHMCIKKEWRVSVVIFDSTYFMFCLVLLCQKIYYYITIIIEYYTKIEKKIDNINFSRIIFETKTLIYPRESLKEKDGK